MECTFTIMAFSFVDFFFFEIHLFFPFLKQIGKRVIKT